MRTVRFRKVCRCRMTATSDSSSSPRSSLAVRRLQVRYFALLREQARCGEESIGTTAATPGDLYAELRARHGFTLEANLVRAVINEKYVAMSDPLHEGDRVVFVPPVAGG